MVVVQKKLPDIASAKKEETSSGATQERAAGRPALEPIAAGTVPQESARQFDEYVRNLASIKLRGRDFNDITSQEYTRITNHAKNIRVKVEKYGTGWDRGRLENALKVIREKIEEVGDRLGVAEESGNDKLPVIRAAHDELKGAKGAIEKALKEF